MAMGSGTKALSTTPVQLHAGRPCAEVTVCNDDAAIDILIGHVSGTQSFRVKPGTNSGPMHVRNLNLVWVKSASGTPTCSYRFS